MHFRRRRRRKRSAGRASSTSAIGLPRAYFIVADCSLVPASLRPARRFFAPEPLFEAPRCSRGGFHGRAAHPMKFPVSEVHRAGSASRQIHHRVDGMSDSRIAFPSPTSKFPRSDRRREIFFGQRVRSGRQSQQRSNGSVVGSTQRIHERIIVIGSRRLRPFTICRGRPRPDRRAGFSLRQKASASINQIIASRTFALFG